MSGANRWCARRRTPTDVLCERTWITWCLEIFSSRRKSRSLSTKISIGCANLNWIREMNIANELKLLPTSRKELRKFGLLIGGILSLLGVWFIYRGKPAGPFLLYPGLTLFVVGVTCPLYL